MSVPVIHESDVEALNLPGRQLSWVVSPDEADCPRDTCRSNAAAGALGLDASFPSGHVAPPAHGGCTCTLVGAEG